MVYVALQVLLCHVLSCSLSDNSLFSSLDKPENNVSKSCFTIPSKYKNILFHSVNNISKLTSFRFLFATNSLFLNIAAKDLSNSSAFSFLDWVLGCCLFRLIDWSIDAAWGNSSRSSSELIKSLFFVIFLIRLFHFYTYHMIIEYMECTKKR